MKIIFTKLFNKTLKKQLAFCIVLLISVNALAQVTATEDFENEATANATTSHTFSESGISFSTDLTFQKFVTTFGYNNSTSYIQVNGNTVTKTITIQNASTSFKINSFAGYVATQTNGNGATNGAITFVGTLVGGSTVTATVNVASTGVVPGGQTREANMMVNGLNFVGTPLDGVYMTSLSVSTSATVQYAQLDHISFTTQAVVTNQFSINDVTQNEGNSGTSNFTFTVTRSSNTAASSVQVQSSNSSATAGSDYTAFPPTTVNFTAGGALTQTVNVVVIGDVSVEPNETFSMTLSSPSGGVLLDATGTGTIMDDDAINEPFDDETDLTSSFSQSGNNFQTTGKLVVRRNGGNFGAGGTQGYAASSEPYAIGNQGSLQMTSAGKSFNVISVDLWAAAVSGSAPNWTFTPTNGTITFTGTRADGSGTVTHTAAITPSGINVHSTVLFAGSPFDGVQLSAISFATPTGIQYLQIDNFKYGTSTLTNTQLSIDDVSVIEGTGAGNTTATFTVTRTNNTTAFTVDLASSNGTATAGTDYTAFPSTTLTFTSGGALSQTVNVTVLKDANIEQNEIFNMTLSGATNGTVYLKQTGIGTILNDDSVIETFETETNNATTFSESGVSFSATGGYRVRQGSTFGSGSSTFYLSSTNNTVGNQGTFTITTANKAFKMNGLDAWVGTTETSHSSGSVTFTGTLLGGGTVTSTKTITATSATGTGWQQNVTFTGTPLDNVLLTAIQVTTASGLTECDIDNFNFTVVSTLPIIEITDASNNTIINGGAAATANNTDFGNTCLTGGIVSKTYTIKNSGNSDLTLSGSPLAVLGGADAGQFSITTQPTSPITTAGSTTVVVAFDPSSAGVKNATITLTNNDATNSPYVINIKGTGIANPTITTSASSAICAGATSFTIPYTATTGTPTTYSISGTGITTVTDAALPATPITVNLSSGATGSSISYTLTVKNAGGCTSSNVTGSVTVNPLPTLTQSASPSICAGATSFTIPYTATTGTPTTYSISGTGITTVTDAALPATPITVNLSSGATGSSISYILTVKNASGCTSSNITGSVTVNPLPTITKSASPAICEGATTFTIPYTATTGTPTLYSISGSGITTVTDASLPVSPITVNLDGGASGSSISYILIVRNANGCLSNNVSGSVTVNSTPAPTAPTATPASRTTAGSVTLSASGCSGGTLTWLNAATNVAVPSPNNQPSFSSSGTFNFYAKCTGTNTCVSDASTNVSVTVTLCVPLVSSPGNVGINWTGLVSTDWNDACNWNPKWVPDATNSAVVIDLKTNQPTISGTVPSVKLIYVNSGAMLTVASGGTLNASSTTAVLTLQGGNLINDGTINLSGGGSSTGLAIGATASITNRGTITTNNLFGASLQFGNLTFTNESTGIFNGDFKANNNILTLTNSGTINYAGGTYALSLGSAGSSVINSGTISVTAGSGISNPSGSTITNNACGKILVTASGYENGGTTINAGLIQMPNLYNFTNTGTFTNNGVLKANTVSSITNNKMVITNACPIFTLGGSNNYTVSGIFTDAGATNSAGTYTSVGNKFTANNTIPSGSQTLYAQVTDGTCTFVVPFDFDNKKPTSVSVNNTNVCLGTSVTLSGTCPSGTTLTWYTTATGGSNIGTGTNLSNSPTVSTTYYAACEATNCVSGRVATNAISVVSPPVVSLFSQTNVSCNGGNNGTATVTVSSGTAPYTYSWAPSGGTAATATGLSVGTYTVTVTDANSCQKSSTVIITQPSVLVASISGQTNVLCNGASTGSATVTASGGSPSYSYSWAPSGGTLATASGLAAGTYTVTVTDANSCQKTATVNITQPAAFIASITAQTNVLCNGASTGSATVTASSGTAPYTYSWAPSGGTASTATGLTAGTYTVTVTDGNSCQQTTTVNITQPATLVSSISAQTNVTCNGASTGSATVTASGGNPNYTYSWAPSGGTAATATGLAAGTYTVTVTDANSCQKTATVSITQPTALVASISAQTNVLCNGASTGSATVAASGGTPSYTYAWAPSGGTAATATGLAAGTYTVTVTDANACQQTATVSITQPTALVASISAQTNVLCNGASTGSATVTASGGNPFFTNSIAPLGGTATTATNVSPSYTYSWAPSGGTGATATGLAAGTYTITVTDANACQQTATVNITQPSTLVASISAQSNVLCNGASTGSATVTASGGNPNYTYSWAPSGGTAATASGLTAGTYTVTVTDANSCQKTATVTITQPTALVASISAQTNVLCNGVNTGTATVTASGGTPNYTYSWAPSGGTAAAATGLVAGIYTVTVTDANSCQQTATVNITQPTALVASISAQTNIICNGASTGSATITASGGMASYTYAWAPSGGTAATATGLAAGTYTVTVTDANSCQKTATVNISQPTALLVSISAQTNVLCNGASTGLATVTASNGTAPYSYSWAPLGGTSATASGLAAGTYTVTVTDANSCQQTAMVNITQPTALVASISTQTNVLCNGASTGSATVTASGGNPNYTYSWAPSGGTAATATGLAAGTYTVTVTDANACQQTATVNITQPTALVASISAQTNVLCNGASTGSATVTASGGNPNYTYTWAPSGGTAATASGLAAGTYTVTVSDANACQQTATVNITQPTAIVASISAQTNVLCNGASTGSATVTASGGNPNYTYTWAPSGGTAATATGLAAGTYTVTVTDANACQQTATVNITQPTSLVASISAQTNVLCNGASTGSATVTASGGNPNYTYSWAPSGGTAATATGLAAGTYTVTVTDANSCQKTATVTITQPTNLLASISAQTNVGCNGASTGTATVTASGGTPNYTYSWAPSGGTSATASGLAAGTYTVTVTDANSCQKTATVTITQPAPLLAPISAQTNVLCNGASTGSATVTASGGSPSYTYLWAPTGGTSATASGLAVGTYTVTVTDANSCQQTATVNITQPTALVAAISAQTNITCDGPSTGSVTVTASGGTPTYTYSWAPSGGTSATATGLAAGTYTVTVTDANGCSATVSTVVTFTNNLQVTQHHQNVSICQGNNATFTVQANLSGVTYQWEVNTGSGFIPVVASAVYSGQNTATLSLAFPSLAYNNYKYRCIITLNSCNATSNEATLSLAGSAEALNIVNVNPISGVYSQTAVAYTIALNKIQPNSNVLFKSGNAIELLPGFETRAGAVFATKIESPCGLNSTNNSIFENLPKEIRK